MPNQPPPPSTRKGTTDVMFLLAALSVLGGAAGGLAWMLQTTTVNCDSFGGCQTEQPHLIAGVIVLVVGILQACFFCGVGLIARSVGEMQAQQLGWTGQPAAISDPGHGLYGRKG